MAWLGCLFHARFLSIACALQPELPLALVHPSFARFLDISRGHGEDHPSSTPDQEHAVIQLCAVSYLATSPVTSIIPRKTIAVSARSVRTIHLEQQHWPVVVEGCFHVPSFWLWMRQFVHDTVQLGDDCLWMFFCLSKAAGGLRQKAAYHGEALHPRH